MPKPTDTQTTPEPETYNDMKREVGRLVSNMHGAGVDESINLALMFICARIDKLQRQISEISPEISPELDHAN